MLGYFENLGFQGLIFSGLAGLQGGGKLSQDFLAETTHTFFSAKLYLSGGPGRKAGLGFSGIWAGNPLQVWSPLSAAVPSCRQELRLNETQPKPGAPARAPIRPWQRPWASISGAGAESDPLTLLPASFKASLLLAHSLAPSYKHS